VKPTLRASRVRNAVSPEILILCKSPRARPAEKRALSASNLKLLVGRRAAVADWRLG
jgi:hypothetical protein